MKKGFAALIFLCLLLFGACALADKAPVYWEEPEVIATQAEGELESYGLTFPEDMPLAARNFVLLARAQFEKHNWAKLPKNNEYTSGSIGITGKSAGARCSRSGVRITAACSWSSTSRTSL